MPGYAARTFARVIAAMGPGTDDPAADRREIIEQAWLAELRQRVDLSSLSYQDRVRLADLLVVGGLMTWTAVGALADLTGQDPLDVLAEIADAMPVASDEDDLE